MPAIRKVVVCGAGFLGRHIAKAVISSPKSIGDSDVQVQVSSRRPRKVWESLVAEEKLSTHSLLPPVPIDITDPATLDPALQHAKIVISLVGIMHGSPQDFENVQLKGAENVARAAKTAGAKLIHFSAIGADPSSNIPYVRTKGLAEQSIFAISPDAIIIRPSLVFGPEDDFFNRFARLSKILPFLPVFGGGTSLFQPVYVGDIARLVSHLSCNVGRINTTSSCDFSGKVIEAGGPGVFSYKQLMQIILEATGRRRPIISLPFFMGMIQGAVLEKLPVNLFTVTRAQVAQLKDDNIVSCPMPPNHVSLEDALSRFSSAPLHAVREIVPTYIH
ncbi:NAD(P)-binding protein [Agrocybe pediades]|nr:NAD(P)-binding protein [Agrocybe pediades]